MIGVPTYGRTEWTVENIFAACWNMVTHGSYHRGWIADMFGQADSVPAIIDLPVYERTIRENNLTPLP